VRPRASAGHAVDFDRGDLMATLKTSVDIGASAEQIWRLLTHFPEYPKWNPYLRGVIGPLEVGKRLRMRVRVPQGRVRIVTARVVKAIPAAELRWRRKFLIKGLFDREHTFIMVSNSIKGTTFIQREEFSGVLAPLMAPFVAKKALLGLNLMNAALKKAAESKH
jgi:hypothetical protein